MSRTYRTIAAPMLLVAALSSICFAQMTAMETVRDMGLGINLGNTFEATGSWINGTTVSQYETAWGSPIITEPMIKGYADAGFKTVRIPVAWSNLMTNHQIGGSYTVSPALLNRVEEVVDWVLKHNMYAIVNIHWDGQWWNGQWDESLNNTNGWWRKFSTDSTEAMRKYTSIWEQVSAKFKDKNDRLVFASFNEEGVWDNVWNQYGGSTGADKTRAYGLLRAINQQFVNVVRASGGNNATRLLQVQGYATNIDLTVDQAFQMPNDPRSGGARLAVSVHYYDPFPFTHLEERVCYWECGNQNNWIEPMMTWGTQQDHTDLNDAMQKLVTRFVNNQIPVIIGEYGFAGGGLPREISEVRKYTLAVTRAIYSRNMAPVLWDVQLNKDKGEVIYYYDRTTDPPGLVDPLFADSMRLIVSSSNTSVRDNKIAAAQASSSRPAVVTVRGKTLTVSSRDNADMRIRVIDVQGKVRANFSASGAGSFSLSGIPAGRYFVEVRGNGVKTAQPVVVR